MELHSQVLSLASNEDDPLMIVDWLNIGAFTEAVRLHMTQAALAPPNQQLPLPPFVLPAEVTETSLKLSILNFIRAPEGAPPLGTCILPCKNSEGFVVASRATYLSILPWVTYLNTLHGDIFPLGYLYVHRPRTDTADRMIITSSVPLWG